MITGVCKWRRSRWDGSSGSTLFDIQSFNLHINLFPIDSVLKNKADDNCRLKFGAESVKKELCVQEGKQPSILSENT